LPSSVQARVGIEAGVKMGWEKYLGPKGEFIGMSSFGSSAPVNVVFEKFGFTVDRVLEAARKVLS
jgi:transketolase